MKRNYTIASAKTMITRNRGKIKGNQIVFSGAGPGIKVWGAIDFLKAAGYSFQREGFIPPKKGKSFNQILSDIKQKLLVHVLTRKEE